MIEHGDRECLASSIRQDKNRYKIRISTIVSAFGLLLLSGSLVTHQVYAAEKNPRGSIPKNFSRSVMPEANTSFVKEEPKEKYCQDEESWGRKELETIYKANHVDAPIKEVIKGIFKLVETNVIFEAGILEKEKLNYQFIDVPFIFAMKKLILENKIYCTIETMGGNKGVKVAVIHGGPPKKLIYTPRYPNFEEFRAVIDDIGLEFPGVKISSRAKTGMLMVIGHEDMLKDVENHLKAIDESLIARDKEARDQHLKILNLQREIASTEEQMLKNEADVIEVVSLKYAQVGVQGGGQATGAQTNTGSKVVQGQFGILDTLQQLFPNAIIGKNGQGEAQKNTGEKRYERSTHISGDPFTNSIVIRGTRKEVDGIAEVVKRLDRPPLMIEIQVLVLEIETDRLRSQGGEIGIRGNLGMRPTSYDPTSNMVSQLQPGLPSRGVIEGISQGLLTRGGLVYQGSKFLLDSTLQWMAMENYLTTVAAPRVVTLNNTTATIKNLDRRYFVVTAQQGNDAATNLANVDQGVTLQITPSIIQKGEKRLEAAAGVELEGSREVRMLIKATSSSPTVQYVTGINTNEQSVDTTIIMPEEKTFILGGLFNTSKENVDQGVPGIKDVPILGNFFGNDKQQNRRRETAFFITPRIFRHDSESMKDADKVNYMNSESQMKIDRELLQETRGTPRRQDKFVQPKLDIPENDE